MAEQLGLGKKDDLSYKFFREQCMYHAKGSNGNVWLHTLLWWHGQFYLWEGGRYSPVSNDQMKARIVQFYRKMGTAAKTDVVNQILLNLQGMALLDDETELNSWLNDIKGPRVMVAMNGNISFVDLDKDGMPKLLSHTPDYFTVSILPYDYKPKAMCPRWIEFLNDVMENDEKRILLLQQWAGYLLTPTLKSHKFLLCVGNGANGKGVFFDVIQEMLGFDNCSNVPLTQFGNQFSLSSTYGKLVNATNEGGTQIEQIAETILKEYTAGDRMTFEKKYKDPFHAKPTAKLMIATNELPRFKDRSQGVWRRMLLVPFGKTYAEHEQNLDLADELKEELPGIFNWAYKGMRKLEADRCFVRPERCKQRIEEYKREIHPVRAFLQEKYEFDKAADGLPCKTVYNSYTKWCSENGYKSLNSANFGKEIREIFPKVEKGRPGNRGNRTNYYRGLVCRD